MPYNLKTGTVYVVLGTAEQLLWLLKEQQIVGPRKMLYHPTTTELIEAYEDENIFEALPKIFIIHPKDLVSTGDYALPRGKYLTIADNYYFILWSLVCGSIKLTTPDGKTLNAAEKTKKIVGKPYEILNLSAAVYPHEEHLSKDLAAFLKPYPLTAQRKLAGDYGLMTLEDWEYSSSEQSLIESLNTPEGYKRWSQLTKSEVTKYFLVGQRADAEFILFRRNNVSRISTYLQPFLDLYNRSPRSSRYCVSLGKFALWCYLAHSCWAEADNVGLTSYVPKTGRKKQLNIKKAYTFRPSTKAKIEWLNFIDDSHSKLLKREL